MTKLEAKRREIKTGISTINDLIKDCLKDSNAFDEMPDPSERPMRHVRISFIWALYYLKNNYSYEKAIEDIISRGGNMRTNAAIVGGLVGAATLFA